MLLSRCIAMLENSRMTLVAHFPQTLKCLCVDIDWEMCPSRDRSSALRSEVQSRPTLPILIKVKNSHRIEFYTIFTIIRVSKLHVMNVDFTDEDMHTWASGSNAN